MSPSDSPRARIDPPVDPQAAAGIRGERRIAPAAPRRRRPALRLLGWVAGLALAYLLAGYLLVPALAQGWLQRRLGDVLDRPVTIERVRFDPFGLVADIERLTVARRDGAGGSLLSVARLQVDLAWTSLLQRAPVIQRLRIEKPALEIERDRDGTLSIADLVERWRKAAKTAGAGASMPRFSVANIELSGGRVVIDDEHVGQKHRVEDLTLKVPFISSLPVHGRIEVEPALSATVNGARFTATGQAQPFGSDRRSTLTLDLGTSDLIRYLDYLPWRLPGRLASGRAAARLTLVFAQPQGKSPSLRLSGALTLADVDLREADDRALLALPGASIEVEDFEPRLRRLRIGRAVLSSPTLSIRRAPGLVSVLDGFGGSAPAGTAPPDASGKGIDWSIARIDVIDGRAHVDATRADGARSQFDATGVQAQVDGLEADGRKPASVSLELRAGEGETLSMHGQFAHGPWVATGRFDVKGARLAHWSALLADAWPMKVTSGRLDLAGAFEYTSPAPAGAGTLPLHVLAWKSRLTGLRLEPVATEADAPPAQSIDTLELDGLSLDLVARRIGFSRLKARGLDLRARRGEDGRIDLASLFGAAPATPAADAPPRPAWHLEHGTVELDDAQFVFDDQVAGHRVEHRLVAGSLKVGVPDPVDHMSTLQFDAVYDAFGHVSGEGRVGTSPIRLHLNVDARGVPVGRLQAYAPLPDGVRLSGGTLGAKGVLDLTVPEAGDTVIAWHGPVELADLGVDLGDDPVPVLAFDTARVDRLDAGNAPLRLTAGQLDIGGLAARVEIASDGRLNLAALSAATSSGPSSEPASASPPAADGTRERLADVLRIERVHVAGGRVDLRDGLVEPAYAARVVGIEGTVGPVAPGASAELALDGRVESGGTLRLAGRITPTDPLRGLDVEADAEGIALPTLSPYAARYLGYRIDGGTLGARLHYAIRDRALEATNRFSIAQPVLGDRIDGPEATRVPVPFAIALMRDPHGNVDLDLPIAGSLDDPEFSVSGLIGRRLTELGNQAVGAPFAWLAGLGGHRAAELKQVAFEPGSTQLDSAATARLKALAAGLAARPGLALSIAGVADARADRDAIAQRQFERLLKARKRRGLRGRADEPLDRIKIGRGEYPLLVDALFREAQLPLPTGADGRPRELTVSEKARALIATLPVGDSQLVDLAGARADAVRAWLRGDGGIAGARLAAAPATIESPAGSRRAGAGARVDFGLQAAH